MTGGRVVIPEEAQWADLTPFLGMAHRITALYVFQPQIDVSPLTGFHKLSELVIQPGRGRAVDLDMDTLPSLRSLSISRPARFSGGARSRLRDLHVERPNTEALDMLARLPGLERLKIYGAFPVQIPQSVRVLDLAAAPVPCGLSPLPELEELHLTKITGLTDLSPFAESKRLSKLVVEDVPTLGSCFPFDDGRLHRILIGDVPLGTRPT